MDKRFLVGLLAVLISASLLSFLFSVGVGFTVGGLLLLGLVGGIVIRPHVICVHERTAQVVCSRQHGGVLRVINGPALRLLSPLKEVAGPVIDTKNCSEQVEVRDVLLRNQQPTALRFTVAVMYRHAPHKLDPCQLGEHLPVLTSKWPDEIRRETDYYLRELVADLGNRELLHSSKRRFLERRLERMLKDKLAQLGIEVTTVQLLIRPAIGLQDAVDQVAQRKVSNKSELELLNDLLRTTEGQADATRNLALLKIAQSVGRNEQAFTWVDLATLLDSKETADSEAHTAAPILFAFLPEFLRTDQGQ